jgi:hypothetical protein
MRLWVIYLRFFHVRNQYQQAFLTPLSGRKTSAELTLSLALPCTYTFTFSFLFLTLFFFILPFYILMDNITSIPIFQFSAPTETNLVPWESSQPIQIPSYSLSPWLIAMVQSLSFSGGVDENPYLHI